MGENLTRTRAMRLLRKRFTALPASRSAGRCSLYSRGNRAGVNLVVAPVYGSIQWLIRLVLLKLLIPNGMTLPGEMAVKLL